MMDGRYGYYIFRAKHLEARRVDWHCRVECDHLDGEEQS